MRFDRTLPVRLLAATMLVLGAAQATTVAEPGLELESVLARFDEAQLSTQTIQATFVERRNLALLAEPDVSSGNFFYTRPYSCLWEYTEPQSRFFLLTEEEMVAFFPEKGRAEEIKVRQHHARLFRMLGIGRSSEELSKFYDISMAPDNTIEGTHHLVLEPHRKRLRKRLERVDLWIDAESFVPRRMEFLEPDGDSTLLSFDNMKLNAEIDPSRYQLDIPAGTERVDGLSGFLGSDG